MAKLEEGFFHILLDSISDMVFVIRVLNDEHFVYQYLNLAAKEKTKYDNIEGKSIHEVNTPEVADLLYEKYRKVAINKASLTYQDSFISRQGKERFSHTKLTPLLDDHNHCSHIIAVVHDITQEVKITKELEESEEHFQIIAENAGDLITLINDEGKIIYTSPSYKNILGFDHTEYIDKLFSHNIYPDDQYRVNNHVNEAMNKGKHFSIQFRQYNVQKQVVWSESHGTPVFDDNNSLKHFVVVTRDINKQKKYESTLEYFALHDPLTSLPNRRLFMMRLKEALKKIKDDGNSLAVIVLDIDHFKDINDEMGHDIGDKVIQQFSKRLRKSVTEKDTVARMGGDEFVILLPEMTTDAYVTKVANNIQVELQKPWNIKGNTPKVTTSMGISITSSYKASSSKLLKRADLALYKAKDAGRNTYKVSS